MSDQTPMEPATQPAAAPAQAAPETPFDPTTLPDYDLSQVRDELEEVQAAPGAARELAARHWARLLHDPNYPWRGQQPYPQMPVAKK